MINRSTIMGKRDYAIVLLGTVAGLRAVDIKNLKLSNIDWQLGELQLVQSKPGSTNVLPLTADVGEAIKDYILHARPNKDSVFIRLRPPFVALYDAWSVGDRYRRRAGLEAFDGNGFHSLRHRFASAKLIRWLDEGADLNNKLAYLRAYMGHKELSETAYYIHILPGNLVNSAGAGWTALNAIVSEVTRWEK